MQSAPFRLNPGRVWIILLFILSLPACREHPEFQDNFESDLRWDLSEEIVGDNPCYSSGIGALNCSNEAAFAGNYSLKLWANQRTTLKSNHVRAIKRILNSGVKGIWTYRFYAYIHPKTAQTGQTGPECSIQNTRWISPGTIRTMISGIQYQSAPDVQPPGAWAIWTNFDVRSNTANWVVVHHQPLEAGKWCQIELRVDYTHNRYIYFKINGILKELSEYRIVKEEKFKEPAFWISLEAENLWSNCAGTYENKVYYDNVELLSCRRWWPYCWP